MQPRGRVEEVCRKHSNLGLGSEGERVRARARTTRGIYFRLLSAAMAEVAFFAPHLLEENRRRQAPEERRESSSDRPNCPSGAAHLSISKQTGAGVWQSKRRDRSGTVTGLYDLAHFDMLSPG